LGVRRDRVLVVDDNPANVLLLSRCHTDTSCSATTQGRVVRGAVYVTNTAPLPVARATLGRSIASRRDRRPETTFAGPVVSRACSLTPADVTA